MVVKKNQLNLYRAIEVLFQTPPVPARPGEVLRYEYGGRKEHGRLEQRTLESSIALNVVLEPARRRSGAAPYLPSGHDQYGLGGV